MAESLEILSPGDLLAGRFEIEEILGQGGFGVVYSAHQVGVERPVVVKVLLPAARLEEGVVERFKREARVAAALQHPNTVTIIDFGETNGGLPYLVMERVFGDPLDEIVETTGQFDTERARHVIVQILEALSEAHAAGVIHRDLKPSNVLLCDIHGKKDFVKVIDFGIARLTDQVSGRDDEKSLTATGAVVGTPGYIAPEILTGAKADPRSDLYAVGLIGIELITGAPCYAQATPMARLMAQANEDPAIPDRLPDEHPLARVFSRLVARDPENRYPSADAALADFSKLWSSGDVDPLLITGDVEIVDPVDGLGATAEVAATAAITGERALDGTVVASSDHSDVSIPSTEASARSDVASDDTGRLRVMLAGLATVVLIGAGVLAVLLVSGGDEPGDADDEAVARAPETPETTGDQAPDPNPGDGESPDTSKPPYASGDAPPSPSEPQPQEAPTTLSPDGADTVAKSGTAAVIATASTHEGSADANGDGDQTPAQEPDQVKVTLETRPPGARVLLDGKPIGKTPDTLVIDQSDDPIEIVLSKKRYESETITLTPNEDQEVRERLRRKPRRREKTRQEKRTIEKSREEKRQDKADTERGVLGIGRKN